MITIELNNATNGIIKKVIDTQYNGVDQKAEITTLYELDEEERLPYFLRLIDFLEDISNDLGIHLGNDHDRIQLNFSLDWGDKYTPSMEEINERINDLKGELKELREFKKLTEEENGDNI